MTPRYVDAYGEYVYALYFTDNPDELDAFTDYRFSIGHGPHGGFMLGDIPLTTGQYIVKHADGRVNVLENNVFLTAYEEVPST